jgi:RNA polymerase sigma-70 factor (ECF subfamily)
MLSAASSVDRTPADEAVLVRQAQQGDRQAFAVLVEHYWDPLYRWLYHLSHHRHQAEDVAQEAFMKALGGLGSFKPGSNFKAWLFRIAFNHFLNQRRAEGRVRQRFPQDLAAIQQGPVEQVLSGETLRLLARALGRLPGDFRAAFVLRVDEGMSFREIGKVLCITEATARWRVFKARQKLMNVLGTQLELEEP